MYDHLLRVGVVPLNAGGEAGPDSSVVRELVEKSFATQSTDGKGLMAVAPRLAIENALLILERGIVRTHEACVRALVSMPALQEVFERSPGRASGVDHPVRVVGREESSRLVTSVLETARREVLTFQTVPNAEHPLWTAVGLDRPAQRDRDGTLTERLRRRGVRVRCIFAQEFLDSPHSRAAVERHHSVGLEIRAIRTLPATMLLVDSRTALLPLDAGGTSGTVMFRNGTTTDVLRSAFELHWDRSVPLITPNGADLDVPSETQLVILRLLAAGMKDESIARHLQVSLRTVRRNITSLCEKVGAPTRFTLAAIAAERGWISGPRTSSQDGTWPGIAKGQNRREGLR
jgi:DNA-binding CsgD family transcriptional regulator